MPDQHKMFMKGIEILIKLCENIGIFIKNYKSTIPGSKKSCAWTL